MDSNRERLLAYMCRYNWACLAIDGVRVGPGETAWQRFAREHTDQIEAALQRVEAHVLRERKDGRG